MTVFLVLLVGLVIGSFLNVCVYRLPRGLSPAKGRSFCPHCRHTIPWAVNIPLVSFLVLKGRCRYCKTAIGARYPIIEFLTALLALATWVHTENTLLFGLYFLLLICPLIVITFVDLDTLTIPDGITLPGIFAGIATSIAVNPHAWKGQVISSLLGIFVGGGFLLLLAWYAVKIRKKEGMGGGDIKMAAMLGAFFGPHGMIAIFVVASVTGLLIGATVLLVHQKGKETPIPFGPFLALGALVQFFFPVEFWRLVSGLYI